MDRMSKQLCSLVKADGTLEVSLANVTVPEPGPDEVLVRIEASPINPSDLGLLFAAADLSTARQAGTPAEPMIVADLSPGAVNALKGRVGQSMPVGNEGAGVVVATGSSGEAQALRGRTIAALGGAMYSQYRVLKAAQCLVIPEGTTPAEAASAFVNPLTALGMVETMRREGHKALVHTAAASNLGQMLVRICAEESIGLVNIVRNDAQEQVLRSLGARYVCDSSRPSFVADLTEAIAATGATIAFDAIGGGKLASQILNAMEAAIARTAKEYSRYGSTTMKQVYIYGMLDAGPTVIDRRFGLTWGVGGWLLWPFLQKIGPAAAQKLRERVASGLKTTFASRYAKEISLVEALSLDEIAVYGKRATGEKYLINPNKSN